MARSESNPNRDQGQVPALKPLTSSRSRFAGGEALPRQAFSSPGTTAGRGSEFVEFLEPQRDAKELVLSPDISRTLYDIVDEYRHGDTIRSHGLPLRTRLLFCAPPVAASPLQPRSCRARLVCLS
jgi:hypothetical protein